MEKNSNCTVESLDSTVQGAVKRLAEYPENKQLVFGAGAWGRRYQGYVEQSGLGEIIGFLDNSDQMTAIEGKNGSRIPVYQPKEVKDLEYDIIVISNKSPKQVLEIRNQLDLLGIRPEKVAVLRENSDVMIKMLSSGNLYNGGHGQSSLLVEEFCGLRKSEKFEWLCCGGGRLLRRLRLLYQ